MTPAESIAALSSLPPGAVVSLAKVPARDYHAAPFVSQSLLKDFAANTPAHFVAPKQREASDAMRVGTILHSLVLEPDSPAYHLRPDEYPDSKGTMKPWHGAADWCKKWLADHADLPIASRAEADALDQMRAAVLSQPAFAAILANGQTELSWFTRHPDTGLILKCRTDAIATEPGGTTWIADLKTVRLGGASEAAFAKQVVDFGYHQQAAFYLDVTGASRFLFAVVETEPPFASNLIELDAEAIALGRATYLRTLAAYAECVRNDCWPAYAPGIKRLSLPAWAFKQGNL